jgi:hypothetical protein
MAAPSANVAKLRASKARRLQSYPVDHPKVREVGQALDYEMLAEHAARVVADWPQPTDEQLQRIASLLMAGVAGAPDRQAVIDAGLAALGGDAA